MEEHGSQLAMSATSEKVHCMVADLRSGSQNRQIQAALQLRNLATVVQNKELIRKAGGIQVLLNLLDCGQPDILTTVCIETISCLAADDLQNRVRQDQSRFIC